MGSCSWGTMLGIGVAGMGSAAEGGRREQPASGVARSPAPPRRKERRVEGAGKAISQAAGDAGNKGGRASGGGGELTGLGDQTLLGTMRYDLTITRSGIRFAA